VDAGAAAVIRQALLDLAAKGAAVLVTSQDLDELAEITDRIAVMFHGRLSEPLATAGADRETLGLLMGGSSPEQKETAHAVSA
jgi:simple sugar transport system ATP-binding protein